jgi:hypothetical protein
VAKITITIEDNPNMETVRVKADPLFAELADRSMTGKLTHAEGYAISALLHLRKCDGIARKKRSRSKIFIPPSA